MSDDLQPMVLSVCSYCRAGAGGECHTPGCAFCRSTAPDLPLAATLGRDELVEALAVAEGEYDGCPWETIPERPVHGDDPGWSQADYRQRAEAVLTAAGVIAAREIAAVTDTAA